VTVFSAVVGSVLFGFVARVIVDAFIRRES